MTIADVVAAYKAGLISQAEARACIRAAAQVSFSLNLDELDGASGTAT